MSSQITTPLGIPSEIKFDLPSSMVPSRKFELRVQPYGQSEFIPGNTMRMVLPQMQRTLMNTQTGYVTGNVSFSGLDASGNFFIAGSAYNLYSRQVIRAGSGYVLETIDNVGLLVNSLLSMTLSPSEKLALSNAFGFNDTYGGSNVSVNLTGSNPSFTFAIPLVGILNSTKMWPSWNGDIEIELTLAPVSDCIIRNGPSPNSTIPTSYTLKNVEYVVECLELSPEGYNMVIAQNPQQVVLKTQSYSYGGSSLPGSQGAATIDIPFQIKVNSLKEIVWYANPNNCSDGRVGGVNPNLTSWQVIINGQSYPQRPIQATNRSECFMQNQKAFGSVYSTNHSGCASINEFAVASTGATYNSNYKTYTTSTALDILKTNANKFYNCVDLETINNLKDTLYSGVSTNGTTSTIRLNIGASLSGSTHNIYYWSCHDVLIVMDMVSGITSVIQ